MNRTPPPNPGKTLRSIITKAGEVAQNIVAGAEVRTLGIAMGLLAVVVGEILTRTERVEREAGPFDASTAPPMEALLVACAHPDFAGEGRLLRAAATLPTREALLLAAAIHAHNSGWVYEDTARIRGNDPTVGARVKEAADRVIVALVEIAEGTPAAKNERRSG